MVLARAFGSRVEYRPQRDSCITSASFRASRPESFAGLDEEKQQDRRECNHESGAEHRGSSFGEGIREGILKDVESATKKSDHHESGKPPESAREPAARGQRGSTHTRRVLDEPGAHASVLRGIPVNDSGLSNFQEIEIAEDGRRITLLHNAAAGATRILARNFTVGFYHYLATTRWIDAMPALPGFHDHGPYSSLRKNGCPQRQSQAGPVLCGR